MANTTDIMMTSSPIDEVTSLGFLSQNATIEVSSEEDSVILKVAELLFISVDPIITLGGILLNILNFIIMTRPSLSSSTVSKYRHM